MPSKELIRYIENLLSQQIIEITSLSGGDINDAYLLSTSTRKLVVKVNIASRFPGMFEAEANGLYKLRKTDTFTIPKVLHFEAYNDNAFLMLEYIETGKPAKDFWKVFGEQLARLHTCDTCYFGLETDNYIGSLPQYNSKHSSAVEFYISQRLQPQFEIAMQKGFSFKNLDTFYKNIESEIPNEASSLIHGDLWSGNFMIDPRGLPCLIDPAISYAPREMDIGMMHLFGGFDQELFKVYNEVFPLIEGWKERTTIWQLYYLLVHLNLFGSSYYSKVKNIINQYH